MNHQAIVAKVTEVIEIPSADKIHIVKVLGENCIVSKDIQVGYIGLLFPEGVQLSESYCHHNNLFRDKTKNADPDKAGFFEATRRVRAQPFLKVKSQAYFTSLESLEYLKEARLVDFPLGYAFDKVGDAEICRKYINQATLDRIAKQGKQKLPKQNTTPFFEKHVDSAQFKHAANQIEKGNILHFAAKIHGTSARMAYTKVTIALPKWKQLVNKVLPIFATEKWDYVVGTRNVVISDGTKEGFHGSEQFRFDVMEQVKPFLEKGMSIYGEIAGFANGKPIMPQHDVKALKDKAFTAKYGDTVTYKYGCNEASYRFHIYRITTLGSNGENIDWTQKQIDQWCFDRGLLGPLEVHPPIVYDGNVRDLQDLVESLTERPDVLTEDYIDPTGISEGIIIREDCGGKTPRFYKSKSYAFRVMEGICQAEDTEDAA